MAKDKTTTAEKREEVAEWIKHQHPDYVSMSKYIDVCDDFFAGGDNVLENANYLAKKFMESDDHYTARRNAINLYYDNKIKEPVTSLLNAIFQSKDFSGGASEKETNGIFADFLTNIDGNGQKVNNFMYQAGIKALTQGVGFISVEPRKVFYERPDTPAVVTLDDVRTYKLTPFWKLLDRRIPVDWDFYDGNLRMVKLKFKRKARKSYTDDPSKTNEVYLVWVKESETACSWQYFDDRGDSLGDAVIIPIPEIPLVPVYYNKISDFNAKPLILDAAYTARALYNHDNEITNYVGQSMIAHYVMPVKDSKEAEQLERLSIKNTMMFEPLDGAKGIRSISLDQMPYQTGNTEREKLKNIIAQNLKQRLINENIAQSGVSKSADMFVTNAEVANIAIALEEAENRAHYISALWITGDAERAKEMQINRVYPKTFDLLDVNTKFNELTYYTSAGAPAEFTSEYLKDMIIKTEVYQRLDENKQKAIIDKIDASANPDNREGLITDNDSARQEVEAQLAEMAASFNGTESKDFK